MSRSNLFLILFITVFVAISVDGARPSNCRKQILRTGTADPCPRTRDWYMSKSCKCQDECNLDETCKALYDSRWVCCESATCGNRCRVPFPSPDPRPKQPETIIVTRG